MIFSLPSPAQKLTQQEDTHELSLSARNTLHPYGRPRDLLSYLTFWVLAAAKAAINQEAVSWKAFNSLFYKQSSSAFLMGGRVTERSG